VKVHRVVCAVDCGLKVNLDQVGSQVEGGVGFGLSLVMQAKLTFDKGKVVESNFFNYEVLRLANMPRVDAHIIKSDAPPTGIGEPGVPGVGPAVANAMLALTGRPTRALPFSSAA
jgi:isoquinoline 1-oxidoreductase beta subunit